ncbi:MAG: dienelactone hydrolase family protein [Arcicella sp.]|jgi:carboxymethylenebutenolidase|nr:dienelactone hydrolase family protein [Arcicella sp.]
MNQEIINLYDEYTHKPLSRAEFLKRLSLMTGGMTTALSILPSLESNYAVAQVSENELFTETISYKGINGEMKAYVARPKELRAYPTVIIIHENRGLTPHIEDVARRAAQAGFLAIAPNALSMANPAPANEDEARTAFSQLKAEDNLANFIKVFDYIPTRKDSNQKIGCVGFCWGGAMANSLAVNVANLKAAVAFYGRQPAIVDVPKIKSAVQLHYASLDERVNAGAKEYEEALKANGKNYELFMYEGVNHAFHNDTSAARYNEQAAKLAWQRTIDFFKKYLV